jgi:hypothetical protein
MGPPEIAAKLEGPVSLAEKMRRSLKEHEETKDAALAQRQRQGELRRRARELAPAQFESLANQLEAKDDLLNAEKLERFPPFKYVPVNHRLDAGKFAIELSPYAGIDSYSVRILVGLHPNAAQFLVEVPNIPTREERLNAAIDEDEFCWLDGNGHKRDVYQVLDNAVDALCNLILADLRNRRP